MTITQTATFTLRPLWEGLMRILYCAHVCHVRTIAFRYAFAVMVLGLLAVSSTFANVVVADADSGASSRVGHTGQSSAMLAASHGGSHIRPGTDIAQTSGAAYLSVRVDELEALVRNLNGQIEDLRFEVEMLQKQLQYMQEDTEFRLLDMEDSLKAVNCRLPKPPKGCKKS